MSKIITFSLLLLCLLAGTFAQDAPILSEEDLNDPELLKLLNNYFGCKTWEDGVCVECSDHYYFNNNGVCCEVKPECRIFDREQGVCVACYQGWMINDEGVCQVIDLTNSDQIGCKAWADGNCIECSHRWVFNADGICVPVDDLCAAYDEAGACTECYKGYHIEGAACVRDEVVGPSDLGCKTWDWDNQVCLECSQRWVFNADGVCVPVDDFCAAHDESGACTECYIGYLLTEGVCNVHNVLCKDVAADGTCTSCFSGYVLYKQECLPLSKLADIYLYYAECCPQKLAELKNAE